MTELTPALARAMSACTQFREAHARYPTPRELADLLPPKIDQSGCARPMRDESAKRLMERLMARGYLTPEATPLVALLKDCDALLGRIHTTNGDRLVIAAYRERIAELVGSKP